MEHFLSPRYSPCPWIMIIVPISKKRKSRDNLSRVKQTWIWIPVPWFSNHLCTFHSRPLLVNPGAEYMACVSRRGFLQLSQTHCLVLPARSCKGVYSGFKALMALIVRERKGMSTVGITRTLSPVCLEVMLSAGMDRAYGMRKPGVGSLGGIISYMIQGQWYRTLTWAPFTFSVV